MQQRSRRDHLTSERLRKRFGSQFDLVNYAIRIAQNWVDTGRDMNVTTDIQNPAYNILEEIACNREVMAEKKKEEESMGLDLSAPMSREDIVKAVEAKREQMTH